MGYNFSRKLWTILWWWMSTWIVVSKEAGGDKLSGKDESGFFLPGCVVIPLVLCILPAYTERECDS